MGGGAAPSSEITVIGDAWRCGGQPCEGIAAFSQGYRDGGGREEWLTHFINDVLPCEGSAWEGYDGYNSYYTRAQFSIDTWAKVVAHLGYAAPDDPYFVGRAVAWWSSVISYPGDTSGWPTCWWRGTVP